MKKIVKIPLQAVTALVLLLIVIPLTLGLLLQINAVQNYVAGKLTGYASRKLETTVSLDRIRISLFYKAEFEGLYVEDPVYRDTLLYAGSLSATVSKIDLATGAVGLGTVRLKNGKFFLRQDSTGTLNLNRMTGRLKSGKENKKGDKKDFVLTVASVVVDSLDFEYRKYRPRERETGVNFDHLRFGRLKLSAKRFGIHNDSISMRLTQLSFTDHSGLGIDHLASDRLTVSPATIALKEARIVSGDTDLDAAEISLNYGSWDRMRDFAHDVVLRLDLRPSKLDFSLLSRLTGKEQTGGAVIGFKGRVEGPLAYLKGKLEDMSIENSTLSRIEFAVEGLPDIKKTVFDVNMDHFRSHASDIGTICNRFTGKNIDNIVHALRNIKELDLSGNFNGSLGDFKADAVLNTDLGKLKTDLRIKPSEERRMSLNGNIVIDGFDLGRLLEQEKTGNITLTAQVDGVLSDDSLSIAAKSQIADFGFNGYHYNGIDLNGEFVNKTFRGSVGCNDENLTFDLDGYFDLSGKVPSYAFDLHLDRANLAALHFNRRDSISLVGGTMSANGTGTQIDDLNGSVVIGDLWYINPVDTINTGKIVFNAVNDDQNKRITMNSDFADLTLQGKQSYRNIFDYFTHTVKQYLPSLPDETVVLSRTAAEETGQERQRPSRSGRGSRFAAQKQVSMDSMQNGYYVFRLNVKKANNVAGIFVPGLNMAEGTNLSFLFNPGLNQFSLSFKSDYMTKGTLGVAGLTIDSRNVADSISLFVRAAEVEAAGIYMPNLSIVGSLKDNRIDLSSRFFNTRDSSNALLITRSVFRRNGDTGIPELMVNIRPSYFRVGGQTWQINNNRIVMDSTGIDFQGLEITSRDQRFSLEGRASYHMSDTLSVEISNVDLEPFSAFTEKMGYHLSGYLSGNGRIRAAFGDRVMYAGLQTGKMRINDVEVPDMRLRSVWLDKENAMLYRVTALADTVVSGRYDVRSGIYDMNVRLKKVDLSLLNPLLKGIVSQTTGSADMRLAFSNANPAKRPQLDGRIDIPQLYMTVDFTKVRYGISRGVILVKNNVLTLEKNNLTDIYGASAEINASLDLNDLKKLRFNIQAQPQKLLCLNTTIKDNDLFYGKTFASGRVTISGTPSDLKMDINARTENQSEFYLPLSDKATIEEADFITFTDGRAASSGTDPVKFSLRGERKQKAVLSNKSFDINMILNVQPNTEAQIVIDPKVGDVLRGRGNGTLYLHINPPKDIFTLSGTYQVREGSYLFTMQNFFNKRFIIENGGTIVWNGDPLEAMLDIRAVYKMKASLAPLLGSDRKYSRNVNVECTIRLADRLLRPDIQLGIELPGLDAETQSLVRSTLNTEESVSTQFITLLVMNSFYAESGNQQNVNIGANTAMVTGVEFLSNQLTNWISNDKFNIRLNYRPRSEITSDEFAFDYSHNLLNNRLFFDFEGSYNTNNNRTLNSQTANNLTGNGYLTYIIDKAGNLKGKGFTRTIDTFDENQGLQEAGVGISYKKDFRSFSQLLRERRARIETRRKKREEKRNGQPIETVALSEESPK